jgi:hypothetical protein
LLGNGNAEGAASDAARDIDWMKVRRVQHGLVRPADVHAGSRHGSFTHEQLERADARSRRALRLAHVLAFMVGVLLGFAILRGLADEFRLLCATGILASLAALLAERSHAWWSIGSSSGE